MMLLSCFALLGLCFLLKRFSALSIEQTPFIVVSLVISILYLFAYLHVLPLGVYLLLCLGSAGLLYFSSQLYLSTQETIETYFTAGFIIWLIAFAVVACIASTFPFSSWDEFSHWGQLSKNMVYYAGFQHPGDVIVHQSYPPGGRLFHYFFLCLPGFSEGGAYIAQTLLLMAPLSLFVKNASWKAWYKPVIIILLVLLLMMYYKTAIIIKASIYMDAVSAVFVGVALAFYYQQKNKLHAMFWLVPVMFSFMLFKSLLFPLALLIISITGMDVLIRKEWKSLSGVVLLGLAASAAVVSWALFLSVTHVPTEWNLPLNASTILSIFSSSASTHVKLVVSHYFEAFGQFYPALSVLTFLSSLFAFTYKDARDVVSWLCANAILMLGSYAYGFGLLLMYIYAFPDFKGEGLASFPRYISIYFLSWSLFVFYGAVRALMQQARGRFWKAAQYFLLFASCVGLIALALAKHSHDVRAVKGNRSKIALRSELARMASAVKFAVPERSKIFLVWQNSEGMEAAMLAYEFHPMLTNTIVTSFGPGYSSDHAWTANLTPHQFKKALLGYDYLFLARPDKQFFDLYGGILPGGAQGVHPFLSYTLCLGEGFSPVRADGCVLTEQSAYLFKINVNDGKVVLDPVVM